MNSLIQEEKMEEDPHEPTEASPPASSSQAPTSSGPHPPAGSSPVGPTPDDDLFEAVSLGDPDRPAPDPSASDRAHAVDSVRSSTSDNLNRSSGADAVSNSSPAAAAAAAAAAELHDSLSADMQNSPHYSPSGPAIRPSPSSGSLDSYTSPVGSPQKPSAKPAMPNVPPELVHLVDSAIMGKVESIEKLKSMVLDISHK